MADGFQRAPVRHADGCYLDLPMQAYVDDDAIGGHGALTLASSAPDWRWNQADNALRKVSESTSDAKRLGTMVHMAVLEGLDAFDAKYCPEPDRAAHPLALDTVGDMKVWIDRRNEELLAAGVLDETKKKPTPYKLNKSGKKEEFVARIKAHCEEFDLDEPPFWDELIGTLARGREIIRAEEGAYVRLTEAFARQAYGALLRLADPARGRPEDEGLSEVSVFWTESGIRFKARFDRITMARIIDLKKFGFAPKLQHSLREHCVNEAAKFGYPVQAAMHMRAAAVLPELVLRGRGEVSASGAGATQRIERLKEIAAYWTESPPLFTWLFLRCPGPPVGKPLPFRQSDPMWARAEETIEDAIANYERFIAAAPDGALWMDAQGEDEISDSDWPNWSFGSPSEDRG